MTGTLTSLGDYDQCLRIEVKDQMADWREEDEMNEETVIEKLETEIGSGSESEEANERDDEDDDYMEDKLNLMSRKREKKKKKESSSSQVLKGQYCLLRTRPVLPPPDPRTSLKDVVINVTGTVLEPTIYKDIAAVAHGFYSIPLQSALCIPSTCNPRELEGVIQQILEPIYFTATLGPVCDVKSETISMNKAQIFALIIISIVIFTILTCSMLDVLLASCFPQDSKVNKSALLIICDSFSIMKNTSKLFNLQTESEPKLHFIHGIRVLTMIWVIICHTYTFGTQFLTAIGSVRIEHEIRPLSRTLSMQFILNGWFSVETFFFLR